MDNSTYEIFICLETCVITLPFCIRTQAKPTQDASQYNTNPWVSSGKAKLGKQWTCFSIPQCVSHKIQTIETSLFST